MLEMVLNMLLHSIPLHHGQIAAKTFIYVCVWSKQFSLNPFQLSVAFHIETSHLFCTEKQMTGFYVKRNPEVKCVK